LTAIWVERGIVAFSLNPSAKLEGGAFKVDCLNAKTANEFCLVAGASASSPIDS
jgi:hypothetical protein